MAEKLSWTELRKALAARADVSEKEANAFLNAFSKQLIEALKSDKQVKINGLGIFKLQAVAPRKSVDVTTGEEITIEGYNKVVFAPEAGVKELVESADLKFEAAEVEKSETDPIQKLGAQAEEIVDILGDLGQSPKEEQPEPAVEPQEPVVEPEPAIEPQPVVEQPEPVFYTPQPVIEPEPEIIVQKPRKESHFFRNLLICLVILLLLFFGAYFFFRAQISEWVEKLIPFQPFVTQVDSVETPIEEPLVEQEMTESEELNSEEAVVDDDALTQEQILAEFLQASAGGEDEIEAAGAQELVYAGWITEEPMHEASRLAWMAKRYYGSKIYWPYLYDTNRDRVSNPNLIETGTPIRVPKLTAAQRDTTNAQTMETLERLRRQAEAAMR